MNIPHSHPRYKSLRTRENLVNGVERGITSIHGLIAHGRGEAFDYLIGEKTGRFAREAIKAASSLLLTAENPVISVNGNAAALCPQEIIELADIIPAKLEVNIFHPSKKREREIKKWLLRNGAKDVLLPGKFTISHIGHNRRYCNEKGIAKADAVFVPLEDGDRCKALRNIGKKVITVDLNPLSRTAKTASITIVDNITRALPLLIKTIKTIKMDKQTIKKDKLLDKSKLNRDGLDKGRLNRSESDKKILGDRLKKYNNKKILKEALREIRNLS